MAALGPVGYFRVAIVGVAVIVSLLLSIQFVLLLIVVLVCFVVVFMVVLVCFVVVFNVVLVCFVVVVAFGRVGVGVVCGVGVDTGVVFADDVVITCGFNGIVGSALLAVAELIVSKAEPKSSFPDFKSNKIRLIRVFCSCRAILSRSMVVMKLAACCNILALLIFSPSLTGNKRFNF